jgi:hypothetical protein
VAGEEEELAGRKKRIERTLGLICEVLNEW